MNLKRNFLTFRPPRKLYIKVFNFKLNYFILTPESHLSWYWNRSKSFLKQENKSSYKETYFKDLGILPKLRYYVPRRTYYSLVPSYIVYGSTIWSFTSERKYYWRRFLRKWFFIRKKCMRSLNFFDYLEDNSPNFKSLKILKLQDITQFSISKLIYFHFNDPFSL